MYIISLSYVRPLEDVESQLPQHREYLDRQYSLGLFLASGPKVPREGGVILASGSLSRAELDLLLAEDPFHKHGLAKYHIVEFTPVKYHPALSGLI